MTIRKATPLAMSASGLAIRTIPHGGWTEYHLSAEASGCAPAQWLQAVADFLSRRHALALSGNVFGSSEFLRAFATERAINTCPEFPWSGLIGRLDAKSTAGGYQLRAATGLNVEPIRAQDRLIGYWFEDEQARYASLVDLRPLTISAMPGMQTQEAFALAEAGLKQADMDFHDVVRTWFYLDRILDWYPDFNKVRTAYFQSRNIFGGIMPASTGVGAANLSGAALLMQVDAVRPKSPASRIQRVLSPLQCDAYQYGSAFSRALEIGGTYSRTLHISGTASIEPGGKTAHVDDLEKQMALTFRVVEAMLRQQGMGWADTVQAMAYFRHEVDIERGRRSGLIPAGMPVILTQCDVCRDDLLFEIELKASR